MFAAADEVHVTFFNKLFLVMKMLVFDILFAPSLLTSWRILVMALKKTVPVPSRCHGSP